MTALRSDESRRDNALRGRGIETGRFPTPITTTSAATSTSTSRRIRLGIGATRRLGP